MPDLSNAAIADALEELGDLYELDGAIVHRVLAYRTAAKAVRESAISVAGLARAGRATELPGIGKTLQEKILALVETGAIPAAERLRAKFPPGLIALTRLPGLGSKRARLLHEELGIDSLPALREAALGQRLRAVKGLGPKFEANVLATLEALPEGVPGTAGDGSEVLASARRLLLPAALELGEALARGLRADGPEDARVQVAGSARRGAESVKDVDLVAVTSQPQVLAESLAGLEEIEAASSSGPAGARGRTHSGVAVDLRIAAPAQLGNLLQHFTGSGAHNAALRARAVRAGRHVSEYGILEDSSGTTRTCASEAEVYGLLGLPYVEPELRENRGELDAELPCLIELADIRGDLHCHTIASDGRATIAEMAQAARARGYEYLAITDHSASHGFGNDVSPADLRRQIERVAEIDAGLEDMRLLAGSEVNILPDGSLDYEDELLERARLGRGERAHGLWDGRAADERADDRRDRASAGRRDRSPHGPADRAARALRAGPGGGLRGGGAHGDAAGDQREPRSPRPLRDARARGGRGGSADRDRLRRAPPGHAAEHALGRTHRAPRLAQRGRRGEHPPVARARAPAQTRPLATARSAAA